MRTAFGADFDVPRGYLNTPSIGIPSEPVADAVAGAVARWRVGADAAPVFDDAVEASRAGFADLVGAPTQRVAIGSTVSGLISMVAAAVPDGTSVLTAAAEFTSVTFPFAAQASRGVTVSEVDLAKLPSSLHWYDLVAVSVVQSADGAVLDLDGLRAAADAAGVPVLLDVTQALGWLPVQLDWADWVVGAGYKWLLGPRGAAWLAVHPRALEQTVPHGANWYAGADRWSAVYGLPLRLATDARRLDLSPVWFAHVGAATALPYLAGLDRQRAHAHCVRLADAVLTGLGQPAQGSAIVALDTADAARRLAEAGVQASVRAGRARLGFHLYNTEQDVDLVIDALS